MTGFSHVGALGLGPDSKRVNKPTLVETFEKVKDVACGRKFTLFATQVTSFPPDPRCRIPLERRRGW
jgi:alpha-tubulin suppressor-like RCC1 family protein